MDNKAAEESSGKSGVFISARTIPAPSTVSAAAQAFLANPLNMGESKAPARDDLAAWQAIVDAGNQALTTIFATNAEAYPSEVITHRPGSAPIYEVIPAALLPGADDAAIFYLHGGGFIHGAGMLGAYMAMPIAGQSKIRAFSVDYRMPPSAPFPAGLDDAVEAYRWLLGRYDARRIVVVGTSAGAGLAASCILKARDLGLPLPGGCLLFTPEADLTESGDSFETNDTIDVTLKHRLTDSIALYSDGHDLRDPYLSPIFGDFSKGFAPTHLISGTRDLFLSNTVILHRALLKAGIEAELHIWEAMPHGGFFGAPEDDEVLDEQVRFINKCVTRM